jgi:hypothetical protein
LAIAVVSNTWPAGSGRVEQAIARAALGLPRVVTVDLPLTAADRASYVGSYAFGPLQVRIYEQGDALMGQVMGQTRRMKYQGGHTFVLDSPYEHRLVFEIQAELASKVTLVALPGEFGPGVAAPVFVRRQNSPATPRT